MRQQAPLALPPPAGTAHWDQEVLFSQGVISALASVNSGFIALLAELHGARPGMPVLGLPPGILQPLSRAVAGAGRLALPYALFDLRFREERFWKYEAQSVGSIQDGQVAATADSRLLRFARSGLTLAWHLAQVDPRVARLALGMESATRRVFAALPLGSLDALARRVAPSVSARFCARERFWMQLAAALRLPADDGRLERLRLLGLQLQGADAARTQLLHRRLHRRAEG
jgi:hypothetical protein